MLPRLYTFQIEGNRLIVVDKERVDSIEHFRFPVAVRMGSWKGERPSPARHTINAAFNW